MTAAVFEERTDPGQLASALLSAAVHMLLLAVLIFGVRWQSRPPEAVQVELWEPPPPATEAPKPVPVPKVEPPAVVKPEPVPPKPEIVEQKAEKLKPVPKPPAKVEPKVEPKPPPPKPVAKVEPKPVPKPEPLKPRVDDAQKRIREQLAREQASIAVDQERQRLNKMLAAEASSANSRAQAAWIDKVRLKIKGNIVLPPDIKGNPETVFEVVQLPTGEVLSVKLRKSSGIAALDSAIERAVLKSSPLPKPDGGFTPPREFELRYKPLD